MPFTTLGTLFKGRQEFLADLRRNLVREDRRAVAVHGLGGVGKTRAALEYAWRHDKDYTALLLVSAPTAAELRANLANLAGVLAIESTVTAVDQQVAEVLRWLEAHPGWLLIVDNVDTEDAASEVERLLAKLRAGHVLITSRIANWSAGVEPLELHVLAAADATAFLLERTPHRRRAADDPSAAAAAARELGCLALALEQAGAYINKLRLSFAEYLGRWRQKRPEVLRWHDERLMQYPASVAITWETTFAQLREPEQRLLQVLAWLAPEPIPLFLFDAQPLSEAIPEPREALAGLAAFSLARFEAAGDAVAVHRLVQEVARSRAAEPDRQTALQTALDTVNAAAVGNPQDVRSWPIWTPLAPHVAAATGHADAAGLTGPTSRLMNELGLYLEIRCQFPEAEPLLRRALAIDEASYGPDHPTVAIRLNNVASLLQATNRLGEAEPLMRRALAIDEASYGPDHPNVAIDLNNLAQLLKATNRLGEAEPLSRRDLEIFLQFTLKTGHEHPHLRAAINNYTGLLAAMGRSEAEIQARLEEIGQPFGFRPGAGPSAENAPSPG
ncbi:MAG: tetratricopeptide repeat protein [Candidatus Limnocylindrales bacterium]